MARITMITLGVSDLQRATDFYQAIGFARVPFESEGIAFFDAGNGLQLSLFPRIELAKDAQLSPDGSGFSGITLAQNVNTSKQVIALIDQAVQAGANLVKQPQPVFWGGFSGYFADLDGHLWEVACGAAEYAQEQAEVTA